MYARAVDADDFCGWLEGLRDRHGDGEIILYLDHLRVHKTVLV